jgi:hypothetical protein
MMWAAEMLSPHCGPQIIRPIWCCSEEGEEHGATKNMDIPRQFLLPFGRRHCLAVISQPRTRRTCGTLQGPVSIMMQQQQQPERSLAASVCLPEHWTGYCHARRVQPAKWQWHWSGWVVARPTGKCFRLRATLLCGSTHSNCTDMHS